MSLLIRRWKEAEKLAKKNNKTPSFREPRVAILEGLLFKFWDPVPKRKRQQIQPDPSVQGWAQL